MKFNGNNFECSNTNSNDVLTFIPTFDEFINLLKEKGKKEDVFVIGGASIYHQTLPFVDYVYLTKVDADGGATLFFDNLDKNPNFKCVEEGPFEDDGPYKIKFCKYKNLNVQ